MYYYPHKATLTILLRISEFRLVWCFSRDDLTKHYAEAIDVPRLRAAVRHRVTQVFGGSPQQLCEQLNMNGELLTVRICSMYWQQNLYNVVK